MGIMAKVGDSKPRELVPAGNHIAMCYRMIHTGTVYDERWDKEINKVRITWELTNELRVFDEEKGKQPMVIDKEFTLSMHEKSNLRKYLESWRGKGFTDAECKGFDITNLVGTACMLNVIHNTVEATGKTYANIASISPMPKGMDKPQQFNKPFIWDFENNFSPEFLEGFPDFIKDRIKGSNEYKELEEKLEGAELDKKLTQATAEEPENDLPF